MGFPCVQVCVSSSSSVYAFLVLFIWLFKSLFYLIGFFFGLFALVSCGFGWVGGEVGRSWGRGNCDQNIVYEINLLSILKEDRKYGFSLGRTKHVYLSSISNNE